MALIKCPECGADVSTFAKSCPHCGFPIQDGEPTCYQKKVVTLSQGSTFTFGFYPQTQVRDLSLVNMLNEMVSPEKGQLLNFEGHRYAKVRKKYFLVEPIEWKVLKVIGDAVLAVSVNILDAHKFSGGGSNQYGRSAVRKWLNSDFIGTAFDGDDQFLVPYDVSDGKGRLADKVFLLSRSELYDRGLGFSYDIDRRAYQTDYSLQVEYGSTKRRVEGYYYTRTPSTSKHLRMDRYGEYTETSEDVMRINNSGEADHWYWPKESVGIRPAILLKLIAFPENR